jgi:hypothetical protein
VVQRILSRPVTPCKPVERERWGGKVESATAGPGPWSDLYAGSVSMPASARSLKPPMLNTVV